MDDRLADDGFTDQDPDARWIGRRDPVLDFEEALREEVVLEVPRYHVPPEKRGRCGRCGELVAAFRHVEDDVSEGVDPRWSALEALRSRGPRPN